MKRLLLLIIFFLLGSAGNAACYEVMVIKSNQSKINQQIQQSFIQELNKRIPASGLKSIQPHQIQEILLTKKENRPEIKRIQSTRPDLILALGSKALKAALSTSKDIPIVYLLVIKPEKIIGTRTNISGVNLNVDPKTQFNHLTSILPQVKRIGVVYNPKHSNALIKQTKTLRPDLNFITLSTENTSKVPGLLTSLQDKIDLLWMIPDITTTNSKTLQSYFLFSIENKIPLLTFSEKFIKKGATIAITFDTREMGKQAANLAVNLLTNRTTDPLPTSIPPKMKTVINYKIAAKLRIPITEKGQTND